jgi:hypothetical protein
MSTAMFGISVPITKRMEVVNQMMALFLSGGVQKPPRAGFTESLFKDEGGEWKVPLPSHLKFAGSAGCFDGHSL